MSDTITITDRNDVLPTDIVTLRKGEFTVTGPQTGCGDNIHIHEGDIRLYGVDICTDDGWEFVSATREAPVHKIGLAGVATVASGDSTGTGRTFHKVHGFLVGKGRFIEPTVSGWNVWDPTDWDNFVPDPDSTALAAQNLIRAQEIEQEGRLFEQDRAEKFQRRAKSAEAEVERLEPALAMAISDRDAWKEKWEDNEATLTRVENMLAGWKNNRIFFHATELLTAEMEREDDEVAEESKSDLVPFWRDAKAGDWIERHAGDVLRFAPVGVVVCCGGDMWVMNASSTWLNLDGGSSFISSEHLAAIGVPVILSVPVKS